MDLQLIVIRANIILYHAISHVIMYFMEVYTGFHHGYHHFLAMVTIFGSQEPLVLEPHIAQILRPLVATLLPSLLAEFAASVILLEDAKCEMAGLSNTCGLPVFK